MSVAPRTSLLEAKKKEWAAQADMSYSVSAPTPQRRVGSTGGGGGLSLTCRCHARLTLLQISSHEHYVSYPEHKKQPVAVKTRSFCASFDK